MTKEEAWLAWMKAAKTTDTPIETDFELIKKTSWWQAFEAGWDLASVNLNGWDQAYAMGLEAGKEVRMTDLRKAAELALEALEDVFDLEKKDVAAIQALRQALAEPKREWVGLTDEEKQGVLEDATGDGGHVYYDTLFRTIEAKLKEKNT